MSRLDSQSTDADDILQYIRTAKRADSVTEALKAMRLARQILDHSINRLKKGDSEVTAEDYFNNTFK